MNGQGIPEIIETTMNKIREMVDSSPTFFARIGGKVVECTERSSSPKPSGPFDDYKSYGRGIYIGEKPE